jgi:hypothetical protein
MTRKLYSLSALFILTIGAFSQQSKVIDRMIELGRTDNQAMQHLDVLCNRFGGRPVGSDAYEIAALWCASEFRKWGMEVIVDEAGTVPVGFNRGPWSGRMLSDNGMVLHFATPSYTAGTRGVQRGPVLIEPKNRAEFDSMKGALKGAWVLISGKNDGWPVDWSIKGDSIRASVIVYNDSLTKAAHENRRGGPGGPTRGFGTSPDLKLREEPALFYKEMCKAGILGVIQSSEVPIRALYDRKNIDKLTFETLPTVCDIKLDEAQYSVIEKMVKERRYFLLEFDIRNHFKPGPVKYHNVIGVIRGTQYPDEYVMVGSHLDAFDVASGCIDDGSGSATSMEAARLIMAAGGKPKRTIMVCLWAAEEFGLLGSKHWVDANKEKLSKISNYVNRDPGSSVATGINVNENMYADFEKISKPLEEINPEFPFKLNKNTQPPRPRPARGSGSDYAYFAMSGVPVIGLDETDPKGNDFSYGEIWHTENDLFNKSVPAYQEHTALVTAVVVYGIANLDHLLSRKNLYAEDEVKK